MTPAPTISWGFLLIGAGLPAQTDQVISSSVMNCYAKLALKNSLSDGKVLEPILA
jgi:hypothetical protein